jgi:hypothetical protein
MTKTLPDLAASINELHLQISGQYDRKLRCGRDLLAAKAQVSPGLWLVWLEANCPDVGERSAQMYMRLAKKHDTQPEKISDSTTLTGALAKASKTGLPDIWKDAGPVGTEDIRIDETWDADYERLLEKAQQTLLSGGQPKKVASPPGFEVLWKLPVRLFVSAGRDSASQPQAGQ